jgi:hypothetical protein
MPASKRAILFESSMNVLPSVMFPGVRLGKNDHTCRVAMQKIAPSDGTELALREESRCRDWAKPFLHGSAIMMGPVKESFSPPATAE